MFRLLWLGVVVGGIGWGATCSLSGVGLGWEEVQIGGDWVSCSREPYGGAWIAEGEREWIISLSVGLEEVMAEVGMEIGGQETIEGLEGIDNIRQYVRFSVSSQSYTSDGERSQAGMTYDFALNGGGVELLPLFPETGIDVYYVDLPVVGGRATLDWTFSMEAMVYAADPYVNAYTTGRFDFVPLWQEELPNINNPEPAYMGLGGLLLMIGAMGWQRHRYRVLNRNTSTSSPHQRLP